MLNETFIGISQKLNQVFGDDYEVHTGSIKQGLIEPCFLITALKGSHELIFANLYLQKQPFDILYYPKDKDDVMSETSAVIASMQMEMEYITVGSETVRGTKMNTEVIDDVLHFFVNYDIRVRKEIVPEEFMGTITLTEEVKM